MNSATQVLRDEHEVILKMLDALENIAHRLDVGESIPEDVLDGLHEFFTQFADCCHHGKEEELLFPFLENKGMPRAGGPLGCMLDEHTQGRQLIQVMRRSSKGCVAGDRAAKNEWAEAARSYAALLRNHIWKENQILFRMADQLISADEQELLFAEFAKVDGGKMATGAQVQLNEKLQKLVGETAAHAG